MVLVHRRRGALQRDVERELARGLAQRAREGAVREPSTVGLHNDARRAFIFGDLDPRGQLVVHRGLAAGEGHELTGGDRGELRGDVGQALFLVPQRALRAEDTRVVAGVAEENVMHLGLPITPW